MSYSFRVVGATKEDVLKKVEAELDQVIDIQPSHEKDRDAALATATAFIDLLVDDPSQDIRVDVHGALSWKHNPDDPFGRVDPAMTHASVGVSASHVAKS